MSDNSSSSSSGIGVLGVLGVVFITLKLLGYITWSWWWVTAPLWGTTAFVLALCVLFLGGAGTAVAIAGTVAWVSERKHTKRIGGRSP